MAFMLKNHGMARPLPMTVARPQSGLVQRPVRAAPAAIATHRRRGRQLAVQARAAAEPVDRALASLPYLLPFVDAWTYGRYLFVEYPALKAIFSPLHGLIASYYSAGALVSIVAFFALYIGVVQNKRFSNFVRFNAMQAVLLDVVLVLPRLLESLIAPPAFGWGAQVYKYSQSFVWIFIAAWVVYTVVNTALGNYARIPYVAESADAQIA